MLPLHPAPETGAQRNRLCRALFCLLTGLLALLADSSYAGEKRVRLAAIESSPYIGQELNQQGYAAELVRAAFEKEGYKLDIRFYPPARARALAASGQVDGLLPTTADPALNEDFLISAPFPGANIGLLKKRSLALSYPADAPQRPLETLRGLSHLRFGALRGANVSAEYEKADFLKREYVSEDLQLLDMLSLDRIDLMVVDKYRAGDLMVLHRPHLIGSLEFLNPPLFRSDFHLALGKRAPSASVLRDAFNRGLAQLERQGAVEQIMLHHGLNRPRPPKANQTVLTIGTVNNADMLIMKELSGQFEKQNPGVRLEWRILDENNLRTRLMTDLATGDGQFDIMTIGSFETPIWAARGWLKAFDELPASYEVDDLLPPVRSSLSYQGKLYALPFYGESSMTYYRTDLFRRAGLSMPEKPTYSDIRRFAAALHKPEQQIYGICLRGRPGWGDNMTFLSPMVNSFGGRWLNEKWQPELDSAAWHQATTLYVDLLRNFGPPDATHNSFNENLKLFAAGRCAMWIDATVAAGLLFNPKNSTVATTTGFAPAPAETTSVGSSWLWTWALGIPESSHQKILARRFVEWATSAAYVHSVAKKEGWVAVPPGTRYSTYAHAEYRAVAPFSGFVRDTILKSDPKLKGRNYLGIQWVSMAEFPAIGHLAGQEVSRAVNGRQSVEQALQNAQIGISRLLQDAGYGKRQAAPAQ